MIINFLKEDSSVAKHLEGKNKKNHIEIEFYDDGDLDRILELLHDDGE